MSQNVFLWSGESGKCATSKEKKGIGMRHCETGRGQIKVQNETRMWSNGTGKS